MIRSLIKVATAAIAIGTAAPALAEFPERAVSIVVPYGAGGATDISARALSKSLREVVPVPVTIVNRPGAGGATGTVSVQNAATDGYTMLAARIGTHSLSLAMRANLPYTIEDFDFLGVYELNPIVCVVNPRSKHNSVTDVVAAANAGEKPSYATSGVGNVQHLGAIMVLDAFGAEDAVNGVTHIPFAGGGEAAAAMLAGTADFACDNSSSLIGFIQAGQLKPLLVTSSDRIDGIDAPKVAELGHPELEVLVGWTGIAAPAGVDPAIEETWISWLDAAVADPEFVEVMTSRGSIIGLKTPKESIDFIMNQYNTFYDLVTELGIRIEN